MKSYKKDDFERLINFLKENIKVYNEYNKIYPSDVGNAYRNGLVDAYGVSLKELEKIIREGN